MKPYSAYKDTGVNWIGKLPSHWNSVRIKYSDNVIMGQSPSSDDYNLEQIGLPFLQGNADFTELHPLPRVWCSTANKIAQEGDVLLSVRAPIGAVNISDQSYGIGRGLCAIRAIKTNPKLLFYFLHAMHEELNSNGTGSTYTAISADDVRNTFIPNIPYSEQQAIADFLDRKTAQIDTLIEKKQRQIDLLQEQRTALINYAVTKGLDPYVTVKDAGADGIDKIPSHWNIKQLRHIIKEGTSITYGIVQAGPDYEGGIPYIRTQDMAGSELPRQGYLRTSPEIDKSYERSKVYSGDIVIAIRATVGKALIVPDYLNGANLTQGTAKVSVSSAAYNRFVYYAINSDNCQNQISSISKGVTFREITLYMLRRVAIPFPPLAEQVQIADYIDKKAYEIDVAIDRVRKEIELMQEYRTALISEAVTGKIDVREWRTVHE